MLSSIVVWRRPVAGGEIDIIRMMMKLMKGCKGVSYEIGREMKRIKDIIE